LVKGLLVWEGDECVWWGGGEHHPAIGNGWLLAVAMGRIGKRGDREVT